MEQLAEYFGMTEEGLGQLLYTTNAFIAGSAPLAVFQKRMFEDMDLDIFLRIPVEWDKQYDKPWKQTYTDKGFYYNYEALAKEKINGFLTIRGYKLVNDNTLDRWKKHYNQSLKKIETDDIEYTQSALSHFIKNITTYQDKEDRKIQIITLYDCSIETFMKTFDLNICRLVIIGCQGTDWGMELMTDHLVELQLDEIRNKDMYIYNPLYRPNLAKRIQKYIGRGYRWVRPRTYEPLVECNHRLNYIQTYEPLEEYSHSLGNIREYISETFIPEITTFEEFMEAKKSHQQTACYSTEEEKGNCDYLSPKEIEDEYDSDVELHKKDPFQTLYLNELK